MNTRYPPNKNLTIHQGKRYKGLPVWEKGDLIWDYLVSIEGVIDKALNEHPRTLAIRFDLHLPVVTNEFNSSLISQFFKKLNNEITKDLRAKKKKNGQVHKSALRYLWVRERNNSYSPHYHVVILLNKDTYYGLGDYGGDGNNLANRIMRAWSDALHVDPFIGRPLVHFPDNATYRLKSNHPSFQEEYRNLFYRLSYFAKTDTKGFGDMVNSFGCSRK